MVPAFSGLSADVGGTKRSSICSSLRTCGWFSLGILILLLRHTRRTIPACYGVSRYGDCLSAQQSTSLLSGAGKRRSWSSGNTYTAIASFAEAQPRVAGEGTEREREGREGRRPFYTTRRLRVGARSERVRRGNRLRRNRWKQPSRSNTSYCSVVYWRLSVGPWRERVCRVYRKH